MTEPSSLEARSNQLTQFSAWLDNSPNYVGLDPEAHDWRRIAKVVEEAGEAFTAFTGTLGENPRKGVTHTIEDVKKELYDAAFSAIGAVEHLNGNKGGALEGFFDHIDYVHTRALGEPEVEDEWEDELEPTHYSDEAIEA